MKGKAEVLEVLAQGLREELGAISQYFVHAEMQENWGYKRLGELIKKQAIGEMKHAEKLIERMLFLEGSPNMADLPRMRIGKTVQEQLENDLAVELAAVAMYNTAVAHCQRAGDFTSAELLKQLLQDEEDHVDFLEAQLGIIKDVGLQNYLTEQTGEDES